MFEIKNQGKSNLIIGLFLAIITIFIWGITFVSTKYLLRYFSALEILIVRFLVAYISLWIINPKILHLKKKSHELLFALSGLTGVTVYQFMENLAVHFTSASNVSIIVSICPLFTAIIAQIFLREKHITFWFTIGFLTAILGIALVSFNGSAVLHLNPKGDFLALGAALSWGFYSLLVSKINLLGYSTLSVTRRTFFWALIFMIPLVIYGSLKGSGQTAIVLDLAQNEYRFKNLLSWFNILFLGIGASAFCFASWSRACAALGTVRATTGIYLIPVVTTVFAFFALGEKITLMGSVGTILTISGLFLSAKKSGTSKSVN